MQKIMIAEDDDSLREIYSIRLTAEGYAVVSARDGEEALAMAVRERPDLIVSDVMMPKITGFDMLDILRSTPGMDGTKVIMMTALSSDEERQRGEALGANRYLVKSQIGIEDVVNAVHEVLGDREQGGAADSAPAAQPAAPVPPVAQSTQQPVPPVAPAAPAAQPVMPAAPTPIAQPPIPPAAPTMPPQI